MLVFKESSSFPTIRDLIKCQRQHGNQNQVLLERFKQWLHNCATIDAVFKHHSTMFTYFGMVLQLFDDATAFSDGTARELVYQLQVPAYAQLNFKNCFQESFLHVVNLLAKWPKATREIPQHNSSINLSGKVGHGIELDAFVESEIVRPLKMYSSGHTTVKMYELIMGNLDLFKAVRGEYKSK